MKVSTVNFAHNEKEIERSHLVSKQYRSELKPLSLERNGGSLYFFRKEFCEKNMINENKFSPF